VPRAKGYASFISIARGSVAEVESPLEPAVRSKLLLSEDTIAATQLANEVGRMLSVLRERLVASSD
jgi:four helix bundle protein